MNEHKHGDAYKVGMLRRMLAHETNACEEHYGARLSHHDVSIKHLTIDAGGIAALIRYYENHDTDLDGGVPEFELFDDELEAAYRKREHEYNYPHFLASIRRKNHRLTKRIAKRTAMRLS